MQFHYDTSVQKIIFGAGKSELLPAIVNDFGWHRLLLCTSPHLRANGTVGKIVSALQQKVVAIFDQTVSHVPYDQVNAAVVIGRQNRCDAVIGLGGGSPIGLAKAVSYELTTRKHAGHQILQPAIPIIAIPTTYAGSEMTPIFGVTHQQGDGSKRKVTKRDEMITPRVALYDPQLTYDLPPQLTAASGVNALAHCIEAAYSKTRNPLSTSAALRGITLIRKALPACVEDGNNITVRSEMLEGAHLAGTALATVAMGIHHGTGHVLGGTAGVPHGVANCIVLPHAIRFNADAEPERLAVVAEALGVLRNGRSDNEMAFLAAEAAQALIGKMNMPRRLREVGLEKSLLPRLAQNLLVSKAVLNNPKPLTSERDAIAYLEAMW